MFQWKDEDLRYRYGVYVVVYTIINCLWPMTFGAENKKESTYDLITLSTNHGVYQSIKIKYTKYQL